MCDRGNKPDKRLFEASVKALTGKEEMNIISDRKESSDEKEDDDNGDFIPIEIFEAITDAKAKTKAFAKAMAETNTMAMATKVPVRHKRKFIALSSSSEE
jgi:hypothetical protein